MKKCNKVCSVLFLVITFLGLLTVSTEAVDQYPSYIVLPDGLTSLGSEAFAGCTNATDIYFPSTVSSIGDFPLDMSQIRVHCVYNSYAWNYFYSNYPGYVQKLIPWNGVKPTGNTLTVQGQIVDKQGSPVSGVSIIITNKNDANDKYYVTTNSNGNWSLKLFENQTYTISYNQDNYTVTGSVTEFIAVDGLTVTETAEKKNQFTFESLGNGNCRISNYTGPQTQTLTIPSQGPDGCTVTEIGRMNQWSTNENGYEQCSSGNYYYKIIIPSSVKAIRKEAFACSYLVNEISLPEGLTTIEGQAFGFNSMTNIHLPDSITTMSEEVFTNCSKLTNINYPLNLREIIPYYEGNTVVRSPFTLLSSFSIIIPEGVTALPDHIFDGSVVASVSLPNTLISIGDAAFKNSQITTINIPDSVTEIGESAFEACDKLGDAVLPRGLKTISEKAFYASNIKSIVIPSEVVSIGESAFQFCDELESIALPKSLETIGDNAFDYCIKLENFRIPENVKSIGDSALARLNEIKVLYFPQSLESLGNYAFSNNKNLTDVYLPGEISTIKTWTIHNYPYLDNGQTRIHTIKDSTVWNYIKSNYSSLEENVQLIPWDGAYPYVSVSGVVTGENGELLKDVAVKAINNEFSDDYVVTWTDYRGQCCLDLTEGDNYTITYWMDGYNFTPEEENFTASDGLTFTATGTLTQTLNDQITFTMKQNGELTDTITVGTSVDFEVTVPDDTEMIRLVVDHVAYETHFLEFGSNTINFSRLISSAGNGNRMVQIQIGSNYAWGDLSYSQTLTVNKNGTLAVPDIHVNEQHERTRDLTVSWDAVDHAQSYTVYVYSGGAQLWPGTGLEPDRITGTSYTLSGDVFQIAGTYSIQVNTVGEGYESSTGYAEIEVADSFDYGDQAASYTVTVYSPISTVLSEATILVTAPDDGYIYQSVQTGDDGTAVINGLKQGQSYRFDCYREYFTFASIDQTPDQAEEAFSFTAQPTDQDYLIVVPTGQQIGKAGGSASFQITSSAAWTADTTSDWLSPANASGNPGDVLTVTAAVNDGYFRTGEIKISMGGREISAYVYQPGELSDRLAVPTITYPAADNDVVPFGNLTVTWDAVDGAASYIIALRNMDTEMLLSTKEAASEETEVTFTTEDFTDNAKYQVAVGAIPAGAQSTDSTVGWCERLFTVPEYHSDEDVTLTVGIREDKISYEAHSVMQNEAGTEKAGNTASIETVHVENAIVKLYYYDPDPEINQYIHVTTYESDSEDHIFTGLVDGGKYTVVCIKDGYDFPEIGFYTKIVHAGDDNCIYVYGSQYSSDTDKINALQRVEMNKALIGKKGGLFAEYFVYEGGLFDKEKSFRAKNKRNEGSVQNIDLSWSSSTTEKPYQIYQLKQHSFADNGKGADLQTINYVPSQFAAKFNGYIQLKGLPPEIDQNNVGTAHYHLRLRGNGDKRINLSFGDNETSYTWPGNWNSGEIKVPLWDKKNNRLYEFVNGTVLRIEIDYKHPSGNANLILEYSIDDGNHWETVPASWFYQGKRKVYIIGNNGSILGDIDYAGMMAAAENDLKDYSDKKLADMLIGLAEDAVDGVVDYIYPEGEVFDSVLTGNKRTISGFFAKHVGKRVAKAFYSAIINDQLDLNDEKGIWMAIIEELNAQFEYDYYFEAFVDLTNADEIDSIGNVQKILKAMIDSGNAQMKQYANEVLAVYRSELNKDIGEHQYEVDDDVPKFFDAVGEAIQNTIVSLIDKVAPGTKTVWNVAKKSFEILNTRWGYEFANYNRAKYSLLYAEEGKIPDQWYVVVNRLTSENAGYMYESWNKYNGKTRSDFENFLNYCNTDHINDFAAKYQGVDLQKMLYLELLKNTLDVTISHYQGLFN